MKTNRAYGSRSQSEYRLARGDIVIVGRSLDTHDKRTNMYGHHYSSSSKRHHYNHHCHHPYRRRESFPEEFNKVKPPTFDGEMKKPKDVEARLLRMNKFFRLHSYSDNMKAKITNFSLRGKENIWWEDVKNVKGIQEEELTWDEFNKIFKKKYLSERYYDDRAKEFYELPMGSMTMMSTITNSWSC